MVNKIRVTLKELKDKYFPNRDLDELRGIVQKESEWIHPMTLREVMEAEGTDGR